MRRGRRGVRNVLTADSHHHISLYTTITIVGSHLDLAEGLGQQLLDAGHVAGRHHGVELLHLPQALVTLACTTWRSEEKREKG